jgi:hypothetical protein
MSPKRPRCDGRRVPGSRRRLVPVWGTHSHGHSGGVRRDFISIPEKKLRQYSRPGTAVKPKNKRKERCLRFCALAGCVTDSDQNGTEQHQRTWLWDLGVARRLVLWLVGSCGNLVVGPAQLSGIGVVCTGSFGEARCLILTSGCPGVIRGGAGPVLGSRGNCVSDLRLRSSAVGLP